MFVQRQLALVGQHQVVARDMQVRRLQHEPASLSRFQPAGRHRCRRHRRTAALVQAGLQGKSFREPGLVRQRPRKTVTHLQLAGLGARCQQRKRRQPQRAQQVGGKVLGRETEGKQKIEMTHGGIVGQSLAGRGRLRCDGLVYCHPVILLRNVLK